MPLEAAQYITTGFGLVAFLGALILLGFRAWLRAKAEAISGASEAKKAEIVSIINKWVPVDLLSLSPETRDRVAILQVQMRARRDLVIATLLFGLAIIIAIVTIIIIYKQNPPEPIKNDKNANFSENPEYRVSSFYYQANDPDYKGPQFWRRVAPNSFSESKTQDGSSLSTSFSVVKRINYADCDGIVVQKAFSPNFQMFIPEKNCPAMELKFRRLPNIDWIDLNVMKDVK